ncbi:unnamed protein product [Aphis gossypii]|uniref:RNA-directed DNA polymerase n=1 Tax=Aphis gossypii TaxID=80765 RepID=A0A9P0NFI1_APHGO|nr:unnamed protein product [Aphis gossypii]
MSESPNRCWEIIKYNPQTLRTTIMSVTLGIESAIRMIPTFTGGSETDLASYILECNYIMENVHETLKPMIFKRMLTSLKGEAFQAVRYRSIPDWAALEAHLRKVFGATHSIGFLQTNLYNIKQKYDEDIKSFAARTEKCYHDLVSALTVGLNKNDAAAVANTHKSGARNAFINGAQPAIRSLLRARNVLTLEEAITLAVEEEEDIRNLNRRFNTNKNNGKNNANKKNIKCNKCNKMGHYANECRSNASTSGSTGFRNPISNRDEKPVVVKKEYQGQVRFCTYCKKNNHTVKDCRKRRYNEEKNNSTSSNENENENSTTSQLNRTVSEIKRNHVRVVTNFEEEHIICSSHNFDPQYIKLLIDSGAEMNLIKLSALNGQVVINEYEKRTIKGINETPIFTIGTIVTTMQISEVGVLVKFDVVFDDFPINESGIIGRNFLKQNKVIMDYNKNTLTIPEQTGLKDIILPPRSNCVLLIKNDENIKHDAITIKKQDVNENVIIANSISPVSTNTIISNIINISEEPFIIDELTTRHIEWEPYYETVLKASFADNDQTDRITKLKNELNTNDLNKEERDNILELCCNYADLFYLPGDYLSATEVVTHTINTPRCTKPINIRPYRLPWAYQEEIEKQVTEMKNSNIIRDSKSPFNFPLVVVKKKNLDSAGKPKLRICVDFRKLNEVTENEAYGLPNLLEILESLGSSKYFSTLDLASGYHQINIEPSDVHKTAFSTKSGHYEYLRMPFGLSSAPATFTRAMKSVLMGLEEMCTAYLDDIVVHGSSLNDHQNKLEQVFNRLRVHRLKLQPQKCSFLRKEVIYLGHVINENGVSPDPNKLKCIKDYPKLKNAKDIKSFLGLLNYYRRFVDNFAKIAKPLTYLLKKDVPFTWTDNCEHSFQELKKALMNPPLLVYPDWEAGKFNLCTDASQYAIGAVLSQGDVPNDQPIAYASRTLNKAENNYSVIQKELLAIVWAVKYFRPYLYGRHFTIITDHRPLTYLFGIKDASSQLMRWRLQLADYDYTIKYRAGPEHSNADCLSRIRVIQTDQTVDNKTFGEFRTAEDKPIFNSKIVEVNDSISKAIESETTIIPIPGDKKITHSEVRGIVENVNSNKIQFSDENRFCVISDTLPLMIFYNMLKTHNTPLEPEGVYQAIVDIKTYCINNDITAFSTIKLDGQSSLTNYARIRTMFRYIFKGTNIVVKIYSGRQYTEEEKQQIIYEHHDSPLGGHAGVSRTVKRLQINHNWRNIKKDVKRYIKNCELCQKNKSHNKTKQPMLITSTVVKPFERICLDIVGPLPKTLLGNMYILTLQDELSRYALAIALSSTDAPTVAQAFVECYVCTYGIPKSILTDCGTNFLSDVFKGMCKLLDIKKVQTTAWHPQTNGFLERSHKTLKTYLRSFVDKDSNWDKLLCYATFCYNTTVHTSTNFTPYELVFGTKPNIPSAFNKDPEPQYNYDNYVFDLKRMMQEAHKIARDNLIKKKETNKTYYDKSLNEIELHVGDKVLIREHNKKNVLSFNWQGPYEVLLVHDNENITIQKGRREYRIHKNNVKRYYDDEQSSSQ